MLACPKHLESGLGTPWAPQCTNEAIQRKMGYTHPWPNIAKFKIISMEGVVELEFSAKERLAASKSSEPANTTIGVFVTVVLFPFTLSPPQLLHQEFVHFFRKVCP